MLTSTIPIRVNLLPPSSALVHGPPTHLKEQGSSSKMAVDEPEALRVVFTLQLPRDPEESDVRNVTEWIDSLDKKFGLELSSVYRANSTMMVFECDKATWYALEGKEGFNFVGELFGTNLRKQEQGALRELPTNKPFKAQRSPMGSGPGGRPGISPNVKSG